MTSFQASTSKSLLHRASLSQCYRWSKEWPTYLSRRKKWPSSTLEKRTCHLLKVEVRIRLLNLQEWKRRYRRLHHLVWEQVWEPRKNHESKNSCSFPWKKQTATPLKTQYSRKMPYLSQITTFLKSTFKRSHRFKNKLLNSQLVPSLKKEREK